MEILDVTTLAPKLKHPAIFDCFDKLQKGDEFIIENDHDPKPLYYQLLAERGPIFGWQYLEEGPATWRVKISKTFTTENNQTIGGLVANDWRNAEVFKKFGIDFCCGGKRTVQEACAKNNIDPAKVEAALKELTNHGSFSNQNFNLWELDFLVDYILNNHHHYVSNAIPFLHEISAKVENVHGNSHPELKQIDWHIQALIKELTLHMRKEEVMLFPYIKELVKAKKLQGRPAHPHFGSIANPISVMESEHSSAGNDMEAIKALSNNFTAPADACNSYRILFAKLEEFEQDLFQHIHLENNILFPKALQLEKELLK